MAENSKISWTRSTFNPWIGCTKIGPGCDHCYAEALDNRMRYGGATHWGPVPRYRTKPSNWQKPAAWNAAAPESEFAGRKGFWPVFCASLADVFDNEVPHDWRVDLWWLIEATPNLSWLLVTKRISNVAKMVPVRWLVSGFPQNVRVLITVVNQEEADRDVPKLLSLPCRNGVSYEPALGPIDWKTSWRSIPIGSEQQGMIEWIIVGGESNQGGGNARPFRIEWARSTIRQCKKAGVPVFVKQAGSFVVDRNDAGFDGCDPGAWPDGTDDKVEHDIYGYVENYQGADVRVKLKDRTGSDPTEWPEDLRVQEFPT